MSGQCSEEKKQHFRSLYVERNYNYVREYKLEKGCEVCGYKEHFAALHLDHIDRSTKKYSVSNMCKKGYALDTIKKEIEKCQVLCANCHHIKSYENEDWLNIK